MFGIFSLLWSYFAIDSVRFGEWSHSKSFKNDYIISRKSHVGNNFRKLIVSLFTESDIFGHSHDKVRSKYFSLLTDSEALEMLDLYEVEPDSENDFPVAPTFIVDDRRLTTGTCVSYDRLNISLSYASSDLLDSTATGYCESIVTYTYYLPPDTSPDDLNTQIHDMWKSEIAQLPSLCQTAMLRAFCSNVYAECSVDDDGDIIVHRPCVDVCFAVHDACGMLLPLLLPNITVTSDTILYTEPFQYLNCSYIDAYETSPGSSVFDHVYSTNPSTCNPVNVNGFEVMNGGKELVTDGMCTTLVTDVFIPNMDLIGKTLPLFLGNFNPVYWNGTANIEWTMPSVQNANVIQKYIDAQLHDTITGLPVWLSVDCQSSLREYFCLSSFLSVEMQKIEDLLSSNDIDVSAIESSLNAISAKQASTGLANEDTGYTNANTGNYSTWALAKDYLVLIPVYPDISVCDNYSDKCSDMISVFNNDKLNPQCDAELSHYVHKMPLFDGIIERMLGTNSFKVFPSASDGEHVVSSWPQSVIVSDNKLSGSTDELELSSTSHMVSAEEQASLEESLVTKCPEGFVVPEHPENSRNQWIAPSGCAIACKIPIYTIDEWDTFIFSARVSSFVGFVCSCVFLYMWLSDPEKRLQTLVVFLALLSFVHSIMSAITHPMEFEKRACIDNSIPYNPDIPFTDDPREGVTAVACTIQSWINLFVTYAIGLCWLLQSIDLSIKIDVLVKWGTGWGSVERYWRLYACLVFIIPFALTVVTVSLQKYGYEKGDIVCVFNSDSSTVNWALYIFFVPIFVFSVLGILILAPVLYNNYVKAFILKKQNVVTNVHNTLFFHLWYLMIYIVITSTRFGVYFRSPIYTKGFVDWLICNFSNYNGDQDELNAICGSHPTVRLHPDHQRFLIISTVGQGFFIAISFVVFDAQAFGRFQKSLQKYLPLSSKKVYCVEDDDKEDIDMEELVKLSKIKPDEEAFEASVKLGDVENFPQSKGNTLIIHQVTQDTAFVEDCQVSDSLSSGATSPKVTTLASLTAAVPPLPEEDVSSQASSTEDEHDPIVLNPKDVIALCKE